MIKEVEFPQFVGGSYTYSSLPVDCQESVNLEAVKVESTASPYKSMLVGTPGTKSLKFKLDGTVYDEIPSGVEGNHCVRGIHRCVVGFGGDLTPALVACVGKYIYEIKKPQDGVSVIKVIAEVPAGYMPDYTGSVSFADGGGEFGSTYPPKLVMADGMFLHVVNMESYAVSTVELDVAPCRPTRLTFLDARVYMCGRDTSTKKDSGHVYWSDINDPGTWDASNFVSGSVLNDPVISVNAVGNYLWLVGTETFEVWQTTTSSGTLYSPIRKVSGGANSVGAVSADSVATIGDNIFFLGGSDLGYCRIYHGNGINAKFISTDAIEQEIAKYETITDAQGFCYSSEGLTYYVLTFPTEDVTWVYNLESKNWHKRSTNLGDNRNHKWNVKAITYAWGGVYGVNSEKATLMQVSRDILDDDGVAIIRRRKCPHMVKNGHDERHASFTLDLECGVGISAGQGVDPQIMLRAYDDGGRTPREERWRSAGVQGAYKTKVKWMRLGHARDRVYEIKVSDPVKWVFYGARAEIEDPVGGI